MHACMYTDTVESRDSQFKFAGPLAQGVLDPAPSAWVFFLRIRLRTRGAPGPRAAERCVPFLSSFSPLSLLFLGCRSVRPQEGTSWAHLGPSGGHLGLSWATLGPTWRHHGPSWGQDAPQQPKYKFSLWFLMILRPILTRSWGLLGPSWGHLGAILRHLGAILGPSWAILGPSWGHLGASWGHLGAILGSGCTPTGNI